MTDKNQQLEALRDAVDRKAEAAEDASHGRPARRPGDEPEPPTGDVPSERERSSRHGQVTADKWNQ